MLSYGFNDDEFGKKLMFRLSFYKLFDVILLNSIFDSLAEFL